VKEKVTCSSALASFRPKMTNVVIGLFCLMCKGNRTLTFWQDLKLLSQIRNDSEEDGCLALTGEWESVSPVLVHTLRRVPSSETCLDTLSSRSSCF